METENKPHHSKPTPFRRVSCAHCGHVLFKVDDAPKDKSVTTHRCKHCHRTCQVTLSVDEMAVTVLKSK